MRMTAGRPMTSATASGLRFNFSSRHGLSQEYILSFYYICISTLYISSGLYGFLSFFTSKINKKENTSWLEVELVTGRTHQIRAHLAYIGYPIIGDGKYGINKINKEFNQKYQQLCSYKIVFENAYGVLEYLKGKIIKI